MRRVALACLAMLAIGALEASPARAQLEWKTTSWRVWCSQRLEDAGRGEIDEMGELMTESYELANEYWRKNFQKHRPDWDEEKIEKEARRRAQEYSEAFTANLRSDCVDGRGARALARELLERASRWLRDMEFGGPNLSPYLAPEERPSPFPSVTFDRGPACEIHYCALLFLPDELGSIGVYRRGVGPYILLNINSVITAEPRAHTLMGSGELWGYGKYIYSPVHELFHAIQRGYSGTTVDQGADWFVEGAAEHVEHVAREKWGTMVERPPGSDSRSRHWDDALHVPPCDPDRRGCRLGAWAYGTSTFWDFLGEELASPDRVAYLHDVMLENLVPHNALEGLDRALRDRLGTDGLFDLYPEFVRRRLNDAEHFDEPRPTTWVRLLEGETEAEADQDGDVLPVAAEYHPLVVETERAARLTIEIDESSAERPADLHLVVDRTRADEEGDGRNRYRTVLPPGVSERFAVRIANVAEKAVDTERQEYRVIYRLEAFDPCDYERLAEAMSKAAPQTHGNPILRATMDAGVPDPETLRELAEKGRAGAHGRASREALRPAAAELQFGGVLDDGGTACVSHIGTNAALEGRERVDDGADTASDGSTLIFLFSPHLTGPTTDPFAMLPWYVEHDGMGGWRSNGSARVPVILPDVDPDELREGESYAARILLPDGRDHVDVYTRWEGEMVDQGAARAFGGGTTWTLRIVDLEGSVTIDKITGALVRGGLDLAGRAELLIEEPLEAGGRDERREGALTISARFAAPAMVEVQRPHLVMRTETIDPENVEETPVPARDPSPRDEPGPGDPAVGDDPAEAGGPGNGAGRRPRGDPCPEECGSGDPDGGVDPGDPADGAGGEEYRGGLVLTLGGGDLVSEPQPVEGDLEDPTRFQVRADGYAVEIRPKAGAVARCSADRPELGRALRAIDRAGRLVVEMRAARVAVAGRTQLGLELDTGLEGAGTLSVFVNGPDHDVHRLQNGVRAVATGAGVTVEGVGTCEDAIDFELALERP